MLMRLLRLSVLLSASIALASAQGLETNARPDQWEEINFEFNSSILSDGYPSLLRLAELLHAHPDYTVMVEGHADSVGSQRYNLKLSRARAEMVEKFLLKYGAAPKQISVVAHGKEKPEVSNATREGRFINRRVSLVARDGQGKTISAGSIGEAIQAMQAQAPQQAQMAQARQCCDDILRRLDKLDEILAAIRDLKSENDRLKQDVAALKQGQAGVEKQVAELPRPPQKAEIEEAAAQAIENAKPSRFSLLGVNIGPSLADINTGVRNLPTDTALATALPPLAHAGAGSVTVNARGRYFAPFGKDGSHAVQAEGEFAYYRDRQEGQFDIGLVNRWNRVQAGLFSSIKHANITNLGGATLGQAAFNADFLFSRGRIGVFGTKGFLTDRVIARRPTFFSTPAGALIFNYNVWTEYFLRVVDQVGASTQVGLWNNAYVEGNLGALFRSAGGNKPGGTVRLVQPISRRLAFTAEASLNESLVASTNNGRVAFGLQFGNWVRPKEFLELKHPVPVDIPRVRYEVLSRQVRTGHTPPVAEAGPDQIGVPAGTITLDASASYSPDGLALTYQWTQIGGPAVQLSSANSAVTTFTAAEGSTYNFRFTVTDALGGQALAKVTVTTKAVPAVRILNFAANPAAISAGESSTLIWQVQNADTVTITPDLGTVASSGSKAVSPAATTTYTLTATNSKGALTQTVTVTVNQPQVKVADFQANPTTIGAGQSTMLYWQTQNADTVTISGGVGTVAASGSTSVSPTVTTTYTLTAANRFGQATATVTITVNVAAPTVVSFLANPPSIAAGQTSTLTWQVTNATTVTISGLGAVSATGTQTVTPAQTTIYTLTTTNDGGETTASATVTVVPAGGGGGPAAITSFKTSAAALTLGQTATLSWTTTGGNRAFISGVGPVPLNGSAVVKPDATTTYTLRVEGPTGAITQQVTITITRPPDSGPPIAVIAGSPNVTTSSPQIVLDACRSVGTDLVYIWRSDQPVTFSAPFSCSTTVTLSTYQPYTFTVTATDAQQRISTATVTVTLVPRR
jgi:hypothetical protein